MDLVDQQAIDALQRAIGYHPFGAPGFSAAFGSLPQAVSMPPGFSYMQGGSFFGPQLLSPHHMVLPPWAGGQGGGMFAEQFMAARGYQYMPRGVAAMDVMRGREFEVGLQRAVGVGEQLDEQRLSRAIEAGFKAALVPTSPATVAHANTMAQMGFLPLQRLGFFRQMPGGSAADFSRHMYLAAQNMRDFTRDRYQLGLGEDASLSMIHRLQDFFAPQGMWDPQRMRGMGFGAMGELAGGLSSFGLLRTGVGQDDIQALAERIGLDVGQLSEQSVESLRGTAQTLNVGRQLQAYADVVGTMREILGAPDAPIPKIISELQQLTGGSMQEMDPNNIRQLLYKIRETGRAANISMTMMMEMVKEGAGMAQQMGLSPIMGGHIAMQTAAATVASQTLMPGPHPGRMTPGREFNIRQQWATRAPFSPASRTSAQTIMLLEEVDRGSLTAAQQNTYDMVMAQAKDYQWNETNRAQLRGHLTTLDIGSARSYQALTSDVGLEEFYEERPEMLSRLFGGQIAETERDLGRAAQSFYRLISAGGVDDRLARQLSDTAAASGSMSVESLMTKIGQSYAHAPSGSVEERMQWLQSQGVDISGIDGAALYRNLARDPRMQYHIQGRGVENDRELSQIISREKYQAARQMDENIDVAIAGRNLLADVDVKLRGGAFERVIGAMAEGHTQVPDILTAAFGFMPTDELVQSIEQVHIERLQQNMNLLKEAKEDMRISGGKYKQEDVDRIQRQVHIDGLALHELIGPSGRFSGVRGTKYPQALLRTITPEVQRAGVTVMDEQATVQERMEALNKLTSASGKWTDEQIKFASFSMPPREGAAFRRMMNIYQREGRAVADKLGEWQQARADGDTVRAEEIEREVLADDYALETMGDIYAPYRLLRSAERAEMARPRVYKPEQAAEVFNRLQDAKDRFLNARTERERRDALAELQGIHQVAGKVLFEEGPGGGIQPKREFIREMVMLDKRYLNDVDAREKRAGQLTEEIQDLMDLRSISTFRPEWQVTDEEMQKMQEEMTAVEFENLRIDTSQFMGIKPIDEEVLTAIQDGTLLDTSVDIHRQIKQAEERGDTETADELRGNLQMARAYDDLNQLRKAFETDMPGLGEREKRRMIRDVGRVLEDTALFEDGGVASDAVRMLFATDRSRAMPYLSALGELAPLAEGEMPTEDAITEALKRGRADLKEQEDADKKSTATDEPEGALTVVFKDSKTGEDLGSGVTIEVNAPSPNRGREASQRVVAGGPGSKWVGGRAVG